METGTLTDEGFIGIYANVGIEHFETGLQRCSENDFRKIPCWIQAFIYTIYGWGKGMLWNN